MIKMSQPKDPIKYQEWKSKLSKTFFKNKERYNYQYTEDQKVILDFTKVNENGI